MQRVVALVGPTGVGKSRIALLLAKKFDGEIVSADSRQVYRHMDIGTAKPTKEEMAEVAHHLIDVVKPDEDFSLAEYQRLAYRAVADIRSRGKLPLLVGGTGQYVWAVVEGWEIPRVAPDVALRTELEKRAAGGEGEVLYQELIQIDPDAAKRIDPRNIRRVIRAIEVSKAAKAPFSSLKKKKAPDFQTLIVGLTTGREELYRRIDSRVDRMVENGLVDEVRKLASTGYGFSLASMSGIGYRQIGEYLQDKLDLESAVRQIKTETHRFVRHQYNWFRLTDDRIQWFDIAGAEADFNVAAAVASFIKAA